MTYDSDTLAIINEEADLYSYASQSLELKRRGKNYYTNCPLHTDITPSLAFSPEKNSFHCFSCQKSGKMIGYLMTFEGKTFEEAVNKAASLANVDLSKMCKSETMSFLKTYKRVRANRQEPYDHLILPESEIKKYEKVVVKEWLNEGIRQDIMDLFGVRVDERSNRIVYPVRDIDGNLINVKGRTRYENYKAMNLQKYMNYFTVGVVDYFQGLDITLPYVKGKREIIIFESVKSVMKAYGWGYKNCASAEKHTLTPEQIDLILKLRVDVVFAYDVDVDYKEESVSEAVDKLKMITNVYVIEDKQRLLGGAKTKNAPVDCGKKIWEELYLNKRKAVSPYR